MDTSAPEGSTSERLPAVLTGPRPLLEGSEVYHESHGVVGQPNSYRRLVVICPLHGDKKRPCKKTRSFGVRSGAASELGDLEPYAFLGAWLAAGRACVAKEEHKCQTPAAAEVREYVISQGWMAQ